MKDFCLDLGSFYNLILTFLSLPLEAQGLGPPARVADMLLGGESMFRTCSNNIKLFFV